METPSSTRRVTRSQTIAALNNSNSSVSISKKIEDSAEKGKSRTGNNNRNQQDRSALIDITNDSPIVGVAMGSSETPLSKQKSKRMKMMKTPGSGEALLRGQVKALLQKVEEEAEISKISFENRPFLHLQGFVNYPMGLLAPTPANTPQILNLSGDAELDKSNGSFTPLPVIEEQLKICQEASKVFESQKSLTRSLLMDFSEKSEVCDSSSSELSSVVTTEEDSASNWSIQVNASTNDEDEDNQVLEEEDYFEDGEEDAGLIDELCEGIGKINMNNESMAAAKFEGKLKKFEYSSDDEIVEENSPKGSILHLKGLPTPAGKHLRFPMDEEDED